MTARNGLPSRYTILGVQMTNRTSWWNEIGHGPDKYPETWEE